MRHSFFYFLTLVPLLFQAFASSGKEWLNITPQEAQFSAEKLKAAQDMIESEGSNAGMVIFKGKVLMSWGNLSEKYELYSCRKSLVSALVGIAADQDKINLTQTLSELKINDSPIKLTSEEQKATLLDLLKSRSGVYHTAALETALMKEKRPQREAHPPGTNFFYSNWDFNTLSVIYERQTKQKIASAFQSQIATPIGMQDFGITDVQYVYERTQSEHPAVTFHLSARDLARFGLLYLQGGEWEGHTVVPSSWVKESTASYSDTNSPLGKGYGYYWWVSPTENDSFVLGTKLGKGALLSEGFGRRFLVVSPKHELVVVSFFNDEKALPGQPPLNGPALGQFLSLILKAKLK